MGRNAFLERSPEAIAQELIAAAELAGIPA
jgi:hypothetical protein